MAMVNKTRNMLEGLVKEGSFRWLTKTRSAYDEEIEEMGRSPSAGKNWLPELSPVANVVVRRCSKILGVAMEQLRENFEEEASDALKIPAKYARNFLEYCCFRALALSTQVTGYLEDKKFRRLTFDMMVAWETPAASSQPLLNQMDEDVSVALEAFSRIAPAVPIMADVVVCDNLFEVLTASTGGRLQFSVYDKYLSALERAIRKLKTQSESSLLSSQRSARGEKILEVDGTVTSQPVLEHVGISTWPGRLILTDHALYFEALRVVSYDKPKAYDLSDDLKQVVRPELTGPWGTRLFDKAFLYKSISISEPVIMELPELKGHTRRDYWLAIIQEVLYAHRFIHKFQITGIQRDEALLKAIFGILRVQALKDLSLTVPLSFNSLLMFNICDELPGGDLILETLAEMSTTRELDRTNSPRSKGRMYSVSASAMASTLGFMFGASSSIGSSAGLLVGEIAVGEMTPLEKVVVECRSTHKKVVDARAKVDGVKVDGIDTNLAVMMELLSPLVEVGNWLQSLAYWEYPWKSIAFCLAFTFIIWRGWLGYTCALLLVFFAVFLVLTRWFNQGRSVDELRVTAPPAKNAVEQLLAVQTVISQAEEVIQDGNICLLKLRGLLLATFPQASEKLAAALLMMALVVAFLPGKYILLLAFLETFTRYSPIRRASTEKWTRRFREWWFSIPAAPVLVERCKEDKKKK
ncbi:OLC1v1014187C2 [Oldenlandia corymbosa var. corymbosa]|uniref:OLC1v1014187C2 n=1 Tax=Oldenlandia corymbosa var. corymbosa TaxID=529605 RepID=A0AAV1E0H0_OLDCO|nr:OLC1v1014187C2 [Oldenlandia corymbosa var. corymbosa]